MGEGDSGRDSWRDDRRRQGLEELKNLVVVVLLVVLVGYFVWRTIPPPLRPSLQDPAPTTSVTVVPTGEPVSPSAAPSG